MSTKIKIYLRNLIKLTAAVPLSRVRAKKPQELNNLFTSGNTTSNLISAKREGKGETPLSLEYLKMVYINKINKLNYLLLSL